MPCGRCSEEGLFCLSQGALERRPYEIGQRMTKDEWFPARRVKSHCSTATCDFRPTPLETAQTSQTHRFYKGAALEADAPLGAVLEPAVGKEKRHGQADDGKNRTFVHEASVSR